MSGRKSYDDMEIGEVICVVIQEGERRYKLFNGMHNGHPIFKYVPVNQVNAPTKD